MSTAVVLYIADAHDQPRMLLAVDSSQSHRYCVPGKTYPAHVPLQCRLNSSHTRWSCYPSSGFQGLRGSVILSIAPWWWWEARPSSLHGDPPPDYHRHRSSSCRPRISVLATVRPRSLCASIIRWRHCRACHLSQRVGAYRSDHRRPNCQHHHVHCWTDRLDDTALALYSRRDRAPLRNAGRHRRISCRTRPRAHWHSR